MSRILIVEDETIIRSALRRLLERHDHRVSEAGSVAEALELDPQYFDLVINDLRLPGELKPLEQVDIFPRVGAFVKQVLVDRGSRVSKGQTLAVLEAPELAAQLARARSRWQAAQA